MEPEDTSSCTPSCLLLQRAVVICSAMANYITIILDLDLSSHVGFVQKEFLKVGKSAVDTESRR